jgi:Cft2 family RNA processing exonuclease
MNSYQVVRTFHPIGQGAFYTERHESFNVVYDCGAMPLSNNSKSIVSSAFSKNDDIDILFISHFDYDHVSAISMLVKSVSSIKTVV